MNKKSILIFIESLQCGGAEKSLLSMLRNFDFDSYTVELLMLKKGGEFEKFLPTEVSIKYLNINLSVFSRLHYRTLKLIDKKQTHNAQLFWKCMGKEIKKHENNYDIAIG